MRLVMLTLVAALLAACGGGGGSDESYVRELCEAISDDFEADVIAAFALEDEAGQLNAYADVFEAYVTELRRANPPSDVETFHDQLVDGIDVAIVRLRSGDNARPRSNLSCRAT